MNTENKCPRCGEGRLKVWSELDGDERLIVPRLPGAGDYPLEERQKMHRWCTRCWYESTGHSAKA